MADKAFTFTKKINRRFPRSGGDPNSPVVRENFLSRDGRNHSMKGTQKAIDTTLTDIPRWTARYSSLEIGVTAPVTLIYTQDGKMWSVNDQTRVATERQVTFKKNSYPESWMFKKSSQTLLYLVDGENLYKYDGNLDFSFLKIKFTDSTGAPVNPIDIIEHRDRSFVISEDFLFISKNLEFDVFDDATDSIQIIVGSGKGKNRAVGKIEDNVYIFNTEGIFVVIGDLISAVAETFEIALVDERRIIAGRTLRKVEKALMFLADDYEIYSWDGNSSRLVSYEEKASIDVSTKRDFLDKAVAHYDSLNKYYMLSIVTKGNAEPNLEFFYDALEDKIDMVRGRNVSCYMSTDATIEEFYTQIGRSDIGAFMWANRTDSFDGVAIVKKLRSRDIPIIAIGINGRVTAIYPQFEPDMGLDLSIGYLIDGRQTGASTQPEGTILGANLKGETIRLGFINIVNQSQFSTRFRPKINFSRGETIAFQIEDSTLNTRLSLVSIGFDVARKGKKRGQGVGK